MYVSFSPRQLITASLVLLFSAGAQATGKHSGDYGHGGGKSDGHHASAVNIGKPGKASAVTRTIKIVMTDNKYAPARISVHKGQTVRFVVGNKGEFVHEFNIGTAAMHAGHQNEMMAMFERGILEVDKIHHGKMKMGGGMAHDDPNSVLLEPGKSAEIIWKFDTDAKLEFACNLPGHYQSGMKGELSVGRKHGRP